MSIVLPLSHSLTKFSTEGVPGETLTWTQRISAAIGVVKGIQFLHGGMVPGLFANDLKITNVLLDEHLVAKISSYNLPILAEDMKCEVITELLHPLLPVGVDQYDFCIFVLIEIILHLSR